MYALRKDLFVLQYYSVCQIGKDKTCFLLCAPYDVKDHANTALCFTYSLQQSSEFLQ